jgi:cytochrome c-type biogenesis protein
MILSAFIAGILMFLAPCTLPLVPGFLAFIGGSGGSHKKEKILLNACLYVLGFTIVFVIFGALVSFISITALGSLRFFMTKLGGIFVILLGLFMLDIIKISSLQKTKQLSVSRFFAPGSPVAAFLLGASFAFGWSPCIGPLLSTILVLASTTASVIQGTVLLFVFSLGMGIPFLLLAITFSSAQKNVQKITKYMPIISKLGGVFLIILGFLLFLVSK